VKQLVAVGGEVAVTSPVAQWTSWRGAEAAVWRSFSPLVALPHDWSRVRTVGFLAA
jgi:hypothetical protein